MSQNYFHVLISKNNNVESPTVLFSDLNEYDLGEKFLKPYRKREKIFVKNEVIDLKSLSFIKIIETNNKIENELDILRANDLQSSDDLSHDGNYVFPVGYGLRNEDIVFSGQDVTDYYINSNINYSNSFFTCEKIMHNVWFQIIFGGIFVGVIVAGLVKFFGWN